MQLTTALIGCGAMSRTWLPAIQKLYGLKVVGLAGIDIARAKQRAAGLTDAIVASTIEDLPAKAKPDLLFDIVGSAAQ
jgi:predicted dehydrogenase